MNRQVEKPALGIRQGEFAGSFLTRSPTLWISRGLVVRREFSTSSFGRALKFLFSATYPTKTPSISAHTIHAFISIGEF